MQTFSSRIRSIGRFRPARLIQAALLLLMVGCVVPSFANTLDLTGSLDQTTPDVAIFKLDVSDYANFSAQTIAVPFGISDTELFLFDSSMLGVYGNDDQGGSDPLSMALSCLPSQNPGSNPCGYDGNGFAPSTNGVYYLAVAYSPDTPLDSMGNPIFQTGFTPILEPTGAGSLAGWDNGIYSQPDFDNNNFEIVVTGVPEPSSLLLVAPGLFLGWLRVKRFVKR